MPDLPTGTVTFLFTDLEGSTKLWERQPDVMRAAIARHNELLSAAIETHEGFVFKLVGDGFCAAFSRPTDAVAAACRLQQSVFSETWPTLVPLRVRVALNTGEAEALDGDYYGAPLNRVARLQGAAHGGQILLSQATYDLIRDTLPEGISLKDLREHRLRDLIRPEHIFQLVHRSLPADFPPLRSLAAFAHNLPIQLTSFIGREKEMAEVKRLLTTTRLLTLTGAGGCGKTRLALQVAADLLDDHSDGVWLVELAALSNPALVPQAVALALGIREEPNRPPLDTLLDCLRAKHFLLVLDNSEHLITACAQLADALLKSCAKGQILATSREPLGIIGEVTWSVPSLTVPEPKHLPPLERLTQYEAVRLFIARAMAVQPNFAVTNANAPAVAQICYELDGIPLALELAAARVRALSAEQIAAGLGDHFRLLTRGSRTALPRHQTLRAAIDWGYDLLTQAERTLLRRLSVFAGGFTLETVEAVCAYKDAGEAKKDRLAEAADIHPPTVLDLLTHLVDKSLVLADEQGGAVRYRMLETLRQYGQEKLRDSGERAPVCRRHLAFFVALAERAEPELRGPRQLEWLDRLETEYDNLRAAAEWSVDSGEAEAGLRLAGALWRLWGLRNYFAEGSERLNQALAVASAHTGARAKALCGAGVLACWMHDRAQARSCLEESIAIWRGVGEKAGLALSLTWLSTVVGFLGDNSTMRSTVEESATIWREVGDKWGLSQSLLRLAWATHEDGDYTKARSLSEECIALGREAGDRWELAHSLWSLGCMVHKSDDAKGRSMMEESIAVYRELGAKWWVASCLAGLAGTVVHRGDYPVGRALLEEGLTISEELGDTRVIAESLHASASIAFDQYDYARVRAFFQEAIAIFQELGDKQSLAKSLRNFWTMALDQTDYEKARAFFEESVAISRESGLKPSTAALNRLGDLALLQGDLGKAEAYYEESMVFCRETGSKDGVAWQKYHFGHVAHARGDFAKARALFEESITSFREEGLKTIIADCIEGFAKVALGQRQMERAARLFAAAESLPKTNGTIFLPVDHAHHEHHVAAVRAALGEEAFAKACAEGRAMTLEEAFACALERGEQPIAG